MNPTRSSIMTRIYLSRTKNFPPQSHRTVWFLPLSLPVAPAPPKPSGIKCSEPWRSFGKSRSSGWLHSFLRTLIALRGCDSFPRRRALISGEEMNKRYRASWNSDRPQKTTCSYLTGTTREPCGKDVKYKQSKKNTNDIWTEDR